MKKFNIWLVVSIILGILIVVSIFTNGFNFIKKTSKGKVTIVEFSDFQCPYCGRAELTLKQLKQDYGSKIEIIYKHFPLNFHQYAQKAAEASECARDQGRFWEYHDLLFGNQDALDLASLKKYAKDLGLDTGKFNSCLDNGGKASVVKNDFNEGIARGVDGTPTFFIGNEALVGAQPYSAFKQIIDKELG
ncbi:MAG: DsbA family protein [Nanoarchaeota archaeon]